MPWVENVSWQIPSSTLGSTVWIVKADVAVITRYSVKGFNNAWLTMRIGFGDSPTSLSVLFWLPIGALKNGLADWITLEAFGSNWDSYQMRVGVYHISFQREGAKDEVVNERCTK